MWIDRPTHPGQPDGWRRRRSRDPRTPGVRTAACCCGRCTTAARRRAPTSPSSPGSRRPACRRSSATCSTPELVEELGRAPTAASASRRRSSGSTPTAATSCASTSPSPTSSSAPSSTSPARSCCGARYDRDERTGPTAPRPSSTRICDDLVADADRPLLGIGVASPGIVDDHGTVVDRRPPRLDRPRLARPTSRRVSACRFTSSTTPTPRRSPSSTFGAANRQQPDLRARRRGCRCRTRARRRAVHRAHRSAAGEIGHVVVDARRRAVHVRQARLPRDRGLRAAARPPPRRPTARDEIDVLGRAGETPRQSRSRRCSARSTSATSCCRARRR